MVPLSSLLNKPVVIRVATEEEKARDPGDFENPTVVIADPNGTLLGMIEVDDLFTATGFYFDKDVEV